MLRDAAEAAPGGAEELRSAAEELRLEAEQFRIAIAEQREVLREMWDTAARWRTGPETDTLES